MWSQHNQSLPKSDVGGVFVKNLEQSINNRILYDMFSAFGSIISCEVLRDEHEISKGYGFVHFQTDEAATISIEKVNGILLNGKKLHVSRFISHKDIEIENRGKTKLLTDVLIENFGENLSEQELRSIFENYGRITGYKITREDGGRSRRIGLVTFEEPQAAERAVAELNGKEIVEGEILYVSQPQRKAEREQELTRRFEQLNVESTNCNVGRNLYIKNLHHTIDDDRLTEEFAPFGTITSAKVMMEEGRSKGFGFVSFSTPEEATRARAEMNGRTIGSKLLYVDYAQGKENRKAYLASHHELRSRSEQLMTVERTNCNLGRNLYVKNLDHTIDDDRLREEFALFGTITSAKVMMEEGCSKGFGFVSFSTQEEATKAREEMNGRTIDSKSLYVDYAQRKENRKAHLTSKYMQRLTDMRMHQMPGAGTSCSYFGAPIVQPQRFYGAAQMAQMRTVPSRFKSSAQMAGLGASDGYCGATISQPQMYYGAAQMAQMRTVPSRFNSSAQMAGLGASGGYFGGTIAQPQRFYGAAQLARMRTVPQWSGTQDGRDAYASMPYIYSTDPDS